MPSPPADWDFRLARNFLQSFHTAARALNDPSIPDPSLYDPQSSLPRPTHLGDFDRLLSFLAGRPADPPPPNEIQESTSSSINLSSTPVSSVPEDDKLKDRTENFDDFINKTQKEVRWEDEIGISPTERPRKKILQNSLNSAAIRQFLKGNSGGDATEEIATPTRPSRRRHRNPQAGSNSDTEKDALVVAIPRRLAPRVLYDPRLNIFAPPPPHLLNRRCDPASIQPRYTLTENEQKAKLIKKLARNFRQEPNLKINILLSISRPRGHFDPNGIHVFIDCSNIIIGCTDRLKANRSMRFARQPPISFSSLALILERGRPVARRILLGSQETKIANNPVKEPSHIVEARQYGYEVSLLERVQKPRTSRNQRRNARTGSGYLTSGPSSASESGMLRMGMQEQGVDEILQYKILESIIDYKTPSTIVLATGDAAEAEYSGGFLANVLRALEHGWKVEVFAWKDGVSAEWTSSKMNKWGGRFQLKLLDDYCEEMLAMYCNNFNSLGNLVSVPVFPFIRDSTRMAHYSF